MSGNEKKPDSRQAKQIILQAAIEEFDRYGYDNASTNRIIKRAGVSKGLLFHYFGNKKRLYLATLENCIDFYISRFRQKTGRLSPDILERVVQFSLIKLEMIREAPHKYGVILSLTDSPREFKDNLKQTYRQYETLVRDTFFGDVDMSAFRPDIDRERALEFMGLTLSAIEHRYVQLYRSRPWTREAWTAVLQEAHAELKEYVDILRYGIYVAGEPTSQ